MSEFICEACGKKYTKSNDGGEMEEMLANLGEASFEHEYVTLCDDCYKEGMQRIILAVKQQRIQTLGVDITIYTDADPIALDAAFINWFFRTKDHSALSLCNYINGKEVHIAFTQMPHL